MCHPALQQTSVFASTNHMHRIEHLHAACCILYCNDLYRTKYTHPVVCASHTYSVPHQPCVPTMRTAPSRRTYPTFIVFHKCHTQLLWAVDNMYIYTFTYTHGSKGLMWCNWHQTTLWTHEAKIMRKRWGRYWPDIKLLYVRGRQNHDDIGWKGEGFQDLIKGGKLISSSPEQGNWSFYSAQLVDKPLHT